MRVTFCLSKYKYLVKLKVLKTYVFFINKINNIYIISILQQPQQFDTEINLSQDGNHLSQSPHPINFLFFPG